MTAKFSQIQLIFVFIYNKHHFHGCCSNENFCQHLYHVVALQGPYQNKIKKIKRTENFIMLVFTITIQIIKHFA